MLFSLLSGLVTGCHTNRTAMHMQPYPETAMGPGNLQKFPHKSDNQSSPDFSVVLLHGFMNVATEVDPIAASLRDAFGSKVLLIQPKCREQTKSFTRCVSRQAKDVFETIEVALKQANQSVGSFPLFIVGYSHGGVVGCALAQKYRDQLTIQGLVTINSPLGGVPVLQRTTADVREFIREAKEGWTMLTQILPDQYEKAFEYTTKTGKPYQPKGWNELGKEMKGFTTWLSRARKVANFPLKSVTDWFMGGGKSLLPDDAAIQDVRRFLREDPHTIPCMLLGSCVDDFGALFDLDSAFDVDAAYAEPMQQFTKAYATFVTGTEDGKHDTLIPLKSQLCRGPSFESLPTADPNDKSWMTHTLPGRPHVQAQVYEDVAHAGNLLVLDGKLYVTSYAIQTLPAAPAVLDRVVTFVREHTDPESQSMKQMQQMGTPGTTGTHDTKGTD